MSAIEKESTQRRVLARTATVQSIDDSRIFAVQSISPGDASPHFTLVVSPTPSDAFNHVARHFIEQGKPEVQLLSIFEKNDIEALLNKMNDAENQVNNES